MNRNHVFHGGPKYTHHSVTCWYRNVCSLMIRFQIGDILIQSGAVHRQSGKLTEIGGFWAPKF